MACCRAQLVMSVLGLAGPPTQIITAVAQSVKYLHRDNEVLEQPINAIMCAANTPETGCALTNRTPSFPISETVQAVRVVRRTGSPALSPESLVTRSCRSWLHAVSSCAARWGPAA